MLTVWRKLNLEIDSMPSVPTSGDQKNFEQDTIQSLTTTGGQTTVTLNSLLLAGPANRCENGYLTVNGASYEIIANTDYSTNFTSGDQVVVEGTVPSSAVGQSCTIVDDDEYLSQLGIPASLPQDQNHAIIIQAIRPAYAKAYIQVEDANALGLNIRPRVTFYLNADGEATVDNVFGSAKDIVDTNEFWAFTITFGYQPKSSLDHDPDTEDLMSGVGLKYPFLSYESAGYAAVYMESIRERNDTIGNLEYYTQINQQMTLDSESQRQALVIKYYNVFYGVVAHEIGHSPGGQNPNDDHAEGGIMQDDAGPITLGFKDVTIKRFRNAQNWTHHSP